jgi:hypothetical protein
VGMNARLFWGGNDGFFGVEPRPKCSLVEFLAAGASIKGFKVNLSLCNNRTRKNEVGYAKEPDRGDRIHGVNPVCWC